MHILSDNYDVDEKSKIQLLISNEQHHKGTFTRTQNMKILLKIKKLKDIMVTYFLTINHVLSSDPQVLACVIPTMERA
jgi:hypothetical protein